MIPVPSYQLIPFVAWLNRRGMTISAQQLHSERLFELASAYLETREESPITLVEIMAAFQTCPMLDEPNVQMQMKHFAQCGRCPHYAPGGMPWLQTDERQDRWAVEHYLHPLLLGFVQSASGSELESKLRAVYEHSGVHPFHYLIFSIGDELQREFSRYLAEIRQRDPSLMDEYYSWHRRLIEEGPRASDKTTEEDGVPLGTNESREDAARRLAASVQAAIEDGYYDALIARDPSVAHYLAILMKGPENVAQAIEFIGWLRQHEPRLTIPGSIPAQELEELALQFCEDNNYPNGRSFSREARRWLSGSGSDTVIRRISGLLGLYRRPPQSDGRRGPKNPLDRYGSVRFHGLFLFLSSGDFPSFISSNWRDLHHLTADYLDIYYSQNDLTDRTSGYEILNQFRSLTIRVDALPALLIWEEELEGATTISLQGLTHSQIIEVMQSVVQQIKFGGTLNAITSRGTDKASSLRQELAGSHIDTLLIERGEVRIAGDIVMKDKVMRDKYENKGIAGAMGPDADVHDNVFTQTVGSPEIVMTPEDRAVVSQLATLLATHEINLVKQAERLEGARYLAALADAETEAHVQEESIAGWRTWLKSLGNRASVVLEFLANSVIIATPIAKLLGFPI